MSDHLVYAIVLGACVCGALIAVGCLGAVLFVSGRESEAERERGGEA